MSEEISREEIAALLARGSEGMTSRDLFSQDEIDKVIEDIGPYWQGDPCKDTISRQAVLDLAVKIELSDSQTFFCISPEDVEALPPVTPKQEPCEDAISRQAAITALKKHFSDGNGIDTECGAYWHHGHVIDVLQGMPSVTPNPCEDAVSREAVGDIIMWYDGQGEILKQIMDLPPVTPKQRTGWIPFTYRPATNEEKKDFAKRTGYNEEDIDTILNCQLPEDGETVLITDRLGNVEVDTFINDGDECYFECNCDMEDVIAWMPLPAPYKAESGK